MASTDEKEIPMTDGPCTTSYNRPTAATLVVRLANGEEWDATTADLEQFRLRDMLASYSRLRELLDRLGLEDRHSSLRYLIERTLAYPDAAGLAFDLDSDDGEDAAVLANVRAGLAGWPSDDDDPADGDGTPPTADKANAEMDELRDRLTAAHRVIRRLDGHQEADVAGQRWMHGDEISVAVIDAGPMSDAELAEYRAATEDPDHSDEM